MRERLLIARLLILGLTFWAAVHSPGALGEDDFPVSEDIVDESISDEPPPRRFEFSPQLSVLSISGLQLPMPGHRVAYTPTLTGLPIVSLLLNRPIADSGRFSFQLQASLGFGTAGGLFTVTPENPLLPVTKEDLSVRWVPMLLSFRTQYRIRRFPSLRPSFTVGIGNLVLLQSSANPALSRTLSVPYLVVSPQITFRDSSAFRWLGGFSFGFSLIRGLGGDSTLAASSLDLSVNFLL